MNEEDYKKQLSALRKDYHKFLKEKYKDFIGRSYKVNGQYYRIIGLEKADFTVMVIADGNIVTETIYHEVVLQWSDEIPKEEFVSLLKETHEFQLQTIGEQQ